MSTTPTHTTNPTNAAGFPPAPPEAHQRAGWVQLEEKDLQRHFLSAEFFISHAALATLSGEGPTLFDVLDWFNGSYESVTVGETREISATLQAYFGFDGSKPNGRCFFVQIDLIPDRNAGAQPMPQTQEQPQSLAEIFGEVIHSYTRAQAIDDGILVDVSETAKEAGFRFPVALTCAAWADCVEWTDADSQRQTCQDEAGRLWDVVWMASIAARIAAGTGEAQRAFTLLRVPRGGRGVKPRLVTLKLICGPGDAGEPVITIMQPNED